MITNLFCKSCQEGTVCYIYEGGYVSYIMCTKCGREKIEY